MNEKIIKLLKEAFLDIEKEDLQSLMKSEDRLLISREKKIFEEIIEEYENQKNENK